jgi:hypothetical protein
MGREMSVTYDRRLKVLEHLFHPGTPNLIIARLNVGSNDLNIGSLGQINIFRYLKCLQITKQKKN